MILNKLGKTLMMTFLGIGLASFSGCGEIDINKLLGGDANSGSSSSGDSWAHLINETSHDVQLNGNTLTYGSHVYTVNGEIDLNALSFQTPTAWVTFTKAPSAL